jgi:Domain of unknown function (DUF4190)
MMPPGYHYAYTGVTRTSGLAIASMVLGILWLYWVGSILALVFSFVALSQMKNDPSLRGKGMAIAGMVLGWIGIAMLVLGIIGYAASNG